MQWLDADLLELKNSFLEEADLCLSKLAQQVNFKTELLAAEIKILAGEMYAIKGGAEFLDWHELSELVNLAANLFFDMSNTLEQAKPEANKFIVKIQDLSALIHQLIAKIQEVLRVANNSNDSNNKAINVLLSECHVLLQTIKTADNQDDSKPIDMVPSIITDDSANNDRAAILADFLQGPEDITEEEFYRLLEQLDKKSRTKNIIIPKAIPQMVSHEKPLAAATVPVAEVHAVDLSLLTNNQSTEINVIPELVNSISLLINNLQILQGSINKLNIKTEALPVPVQQQVTSKAKIIAYSPMSKLFSRMEKLVASVAAETQKNIKLETQSGDFTLADQVMEPLIEVLTHLLRNAIDHGIELPAERGRLNKPIEGKILLIINFKNNLTVLIADDGAGIDLLAIKQSAIENKIITSEQAEQLSTEEALQLIFKPGVSSKKDITITSGRGVGMDIVMQKILSEQWKIQVKSEMGKGTSFTITIPIIDGLVKLNIIKSTG